MDKTILKYALDAVANRIDLNNPIHQNIYGEGFIAGFELATDIAQSKYKLIESKLRELGVIQNETKTKVIRRRI